MPVTQMVVVLSFINVIVSPNYSASVAGNCGAEPRSAQSLPFIRCESTSDSGLYWSEVGGELLSIEAVNVKGKGKVTATGKLGDVMKESVQAAISYVRANSIDLGIHPFDFDKYDIHVHVPEGATPKDGPSAGGAMAISLISIFTGIAVRSDTAMTGEITLRGQVLKIGGLKEKLLAAKRGGIKRVILPKDNAADLTEIPDQILESLEIIPVAWIDEVISNALESEPLPLKKTKSTAKRTRSSKSKTKTNINQTH